MATKQENNIDDRDKDILKLCKKVLSASPSWSYNPNGADYNTCPFCYKERYGESCDMEDIEHDIDCAYFIAKDLSTNLLNQ